jgi:lipopolysaccharide heptosyltransferase II
MPQSKALLQKAHKVAVVRTDKIGDMVLTLPMLKILKEEFPEKEIHLVAKKYLSPLVEDLPFIDKINYLEDYKNISDIFKIEKYDIAFFPRPQLNEALSALLNGISLRVGTKYRWYSFLFNKWIDHHRSHAKKNEAEYNIEMIETITEKNYPCELISPIVNEDDFKQVVNKLKSFRNISTEKYIILHPGSGGSSRDWNTANFSELAKKFVEAKYNVIVTGSIEEVLLGEAIKSYCNEVINITGELSLKEMIALISKSSLLVANSTGVIHIAAALGVPVVGLYPNSPQLSAKRWGPYTNKKAILSPPESEDADERDDMSLINVKDVFEEAIELL